VLAHNAEPGSTVEVEKADGDAEAIDGEDQDQVKITIVKPPVREAVGVGGGAPEDPEGDDAPENAGDSSGEDLPDGPEVLPDVPDATPAPETSRRAEPAPPAQVAGGAGSLLRSS